MSGTDFERISPEPAAQKPAASIPVFDSEKELQQLPPGPERQLILGEVEAGEPLTIEGAARQLRNRRGEQPASGVDFKVDGRRSASPQSDREAARDVTFSRRVEHVGRIMADLPRVDVETAGATVAAAEKGGHVHEFKLDDKDRASPLSHGDDLKTAQQRLSAMREERAAALHELVGQLSEPADEQQSAQTEQPPQVEQPPPLQQTEQPGHPDPVEQLRQQAEAERDAYARMRQATAVEFQLAQTAQQLDQQITNKFIGQIQQAGSIEAFAKANPAGFKELAEAKQLYDTCKANVEHCRQVTLLNQQRMTELHEAKARNEHAAWSKAQDDEVMKYIPELSDPARAAPLQRATLAMLTDVGVSEEELTRLWNGQATLNLRDARAQRILADAAKYREGQAKARVAQKAPLPPVLRPGTGTTKAERSAADQSAQLGQLGYLSPEQAMRQGAKLLAQRRGSR